MSNNNELICPICGAPTSSFMGNARKDRLCRKHSEEFKSGIIIKCNKCEKWYSSNTKCSCETVNTKEKLPESADIVFRIFNHVTQKFDEFSQTFSVGMKINNTASYGFCTIDKIDTKNERIYFSPQHNNSGDNSWAFSTVSGYLANGTIIIPNEIVKPKPQQKPSYKIEFSNKVVIGKDVIDNETKDVRKKWEAGNLCEDGHYVRSYSEILIDNWLYTNEYLHAYEKTVFMKTEPDEIVLCDFYLPKGDVYIEFWGKDTEKYNMRRERKMQLYKDNHYNVISIEQDEIKIIGDILKRKIYDYIK